MIAASLEHIERQLPATDGLIKALKFLRQPGIRGLADGRIEIDGERVFAIVQRYQTIQPGKPKFEYHRTYIDVQFVAIGEEVIGWAPAESMVVTEAYDADKDIAFGTVPDDWTPVLVRAGLAVVLYPEDAHAPRLAVNAPSPVLKIVVKIAVGS